MKYHAADLHPHDIKGIKDVTKLPFISKQDIVEHFPIGILPRGYNKENARIVSTAGSTEKQISIFTDFSIFTGGIGASLRIYA
jgi:phenylacetate-CoA ligase